MYIQTHTDIHLAHTGTAQWIINPYEESLLQGFQFLNFSIERGGGAWRLGRVRQKSLFKRESREGGGRGWVRERRWGEEKGVLYNEIWNLQNIKGFCSQAAVAAEQRGGVHHFLSLCLPPSLFPPPSLFLSIPPSLLKCVSLELGWGAWGWVEGEREKGWEELIRRVGGWGWLKDGLGERKMDERGVLYIYTRVCVRVCACMNNRFYQASLNTACVCMRTCMCAGPWRGECALW